MRIEVFLVFRSFGLTQRDLLIWQRPDFFIGTYLLVYSQWKSVPFFWPSLYKRTITQILYLIQIMYNILRTKRENKFGFSEYLRECITQTDYVLYNKRKKKRHTTSKRIYADEAPWRRPLSLTSSTCYAYVTHWFTCGNHTWYSSSPFIVSQRVLCLYFTQTDIL